MDDGGYAALCSERTLQSDPKGFFMTFAGHVAAEAGAKWVEEVFGRLRDDGEMIRAVYRDKAVKYAVCEVLSNVQEVYRRKNVDLALEKRVSAEKFQSQGNQMKALMLFGQSVLRAPSTKNTPDSTKVLAVSLWKRAQLLLSMDLFSNALADIKLALGEGLPSKYKAEAFWKMGICYSARGERERARVAFELAEKLLEDSQKVEELKRDAGRSWKEEKTERVVPKVERAHRQFPNATAKITVMQSDRMGRHVVANERISTGELVVVEPPYAACLMPEHFGSHCHHCFQRLVSPVGCDTCSNVAFCRPECRDEAMKTYHRFECKFLDLVMGSGMSILSHMALRMVTQFPLKRVLELHGNRDKERVYSLCTNAGQRKAGDFLQRTLMSAFLLRCLQKGGYFRSINSNTSVVPTEDEFKVGELILFHLQMLQFNAHEVYETLCTGHRLRRTKLASVGVAVYPTVALFNHDCYPAVTRHFSGRDIVITAVRPLRGGEVVAENYGPVFTRRPLVERQKTLAARYWFKCECLACRQDWPTADKLDGVSRRLKCPTDGCGYLFTLPVAEETARCPRCRRDVALAGAALRLRQCEEQLKAAAEAAEAEDAERAMGLLCEGIDTFHEVSCPPHRATHLGQELLRACLADGGNVYRCPATAKE